MAVRASTVTTIEPTRRFGGANQPFNRVVWPGITGTISQLVWDPWSALRIPGVARASSIYSGMLKQAPLDQFRGIDPLPRSRLLDQPDPNQSRPWWVQMHVEDYLWSGNALSYITAYDATGWPAAAVWLPAQWVSIACPPRRYDEPTYMVDGVEIDRDRVVHIKRGADRWCPARGVGVVEQHLATLDRVAMEEWYERDQLANGSVPSVAVITPNPRLGDKEAKTAKTEWLDRYAGPGREPAILPAGTQVIPLGWSPSDAQLTQARQMSLLDVANCFNLDGYWVGAPGSSMTYRSPGSMYTNLVRVSLEPVMADFEAIWSAALVPRGNSVRFDRLAITRDDLQTMVTTISMATSTDPPLMTVAEGRALMGLPPAPSDLITTSPVDTPAPAPAPEEDGDSGE